MKFQDSYIDREKRYSIGLELESGMYYLSFPVSNQYVDYEEYYELEPLLFEGFPETKVKIESFLQECRNHKHDNRLLQQPGKYRGSAT